MSKWNSSSPPPLEQLRMFSSHIGGDNFIDYEICEELSNLLDNKDIILVGPAPNIKGKGMGEFIDSFDVVIRPGQLTKIPQSEILDYGSKTTIISQSFNIWEKKIALENIDFLKTLDYVIGCMVCCYECHEYDNFVRKLTDNNIKVHKPNDRYIYKLFNDVGTTLSCGISTLLILLNYNVKSIYITGMDFYNMGKYGKVYRDDYFDTVTLNSMGHLRHNDEKTINPSQARVDLHDQLSQIEYLKELIKIEKRIILDDYLKENLL